MYNTEFSEFECRALGFKFPKDEKHALMDLVGSVEETMDSKTVLKKRQGVAFKTSTRGTGAGTLKITAHVPYETYCKMYAMNIDGLIDGVKAYGYDSVHEKFSVTAEVYNEDNEQKLKAYPQCTMTNGVVRKIENGAEEVAEIELEIAVMPDEYGCGMYEAVASTLTDETVKKTWLEDFTPDLVKDTTPAV